MGKIRILILTLWITAGCATFSKKGFKGDYVKVEFTSVDRYEGRYSLYAKRSLDSMVHDSLLKKTNLYQEIVNEPQSVHDEILENQYDDHTYFVRIEFEGQDSIQIALCNGSEILKDTVFSGTWKKGMFYMDNVFLKCNGIPYLLGGCNHNKRRLVFTPEYNIIVNTAVANEGAFLFLIGSGYRMNMYYEFEKLH